MSDDDVIEGVRRPGRFDVTVASEVEARRLVRAALPHATELPKAEPGVPYPAPPVAVRSWLQVHPPEPAVGHDLPHVKYADWTGGKKGRGGTWGHLFFPSSGSVPSTADEA